jgi:hypothetical protein
MSAGAETGQSSGTPPPHRRRKSVLELVANIWLYALAVTTSLFVVVLVVQGTTRRIRSAARSVTRATVQIPRVTAPSAASAPQLVGSGAQAA